MSEAETPSTNSTDSIPRVSEFEPTPIDILTELPNGFNDSRVTLSVWADYHDLAHWMLPLKHRQHDPIEFGVRIAEAIDSFRRTEATFTRKDLDLSREDVDVTRTLLRRHGAVVRRRSTHRLRYWNPDYMHYDECVDVLTDPEEQVEFFQKFATVGKSLDWMAKHMSHPDTQTAGCSDGTFTSSDLVNVLEQFSDHPDPEAYLTQIQGRIARGIYTTLVWTDRDVSTLAQAINISPTTLRTWVERHAANPDWNPPERPVGKDWFAYSAADPQPDR